MMDKENADFDARLRRRSRSGSPPRWCRWRSRSARGPSSAGSSTSSPRRRTSSRPAPSRGSSRRRRSRRRRRRGSSGTTPRWSRRSPRPTTRCSSASSPTRRSAAEDEMRAMKDAMKRAELFPLLCCSAAAHVWRPDGARLARAAHAERVRDGGAARAQGRRGEPDGGDPSEGGRAVHGARLQDHGEPHVGEVTFFRTFSGTVANGDEVFNATRGAPEKLSHLAVPQGKERIEVPRLYPGRHRLRGQAARHAHQRHAEHRGAPGAPAADRRSPIRS